MPQHPNCTTGGSTSVATSTYCATTTATAIREPSPPSSAPRSWGRHSSSPLLSIQGMLAQPTELAVQHSLLSPEPTRPGLPRAKVLSVRLTTEEFDELSRFAATADVPASALMRG